MSNPLRVGPATPQLHGQPSPGIARQPAQHAPGARAEPGPPKRSSAHVPNSAPPVRNAAARLAARTDGASSGVPESLIPGHRRTLPARSANVADPSPPADSTGPAPAFHPVPKRRHSFSDPFMAMPSAAEHMAVMQAAPASETTAAAPVRLPKVNPPPHALFKNTSPMIARYHGEETGAVWGTRVRHLDDAGRAAHRVTFNPRDGLWYDAQGQRVDTRDAATVVSGGSQGRAIFVVDPVDGHVYMSKYQAVGKFHHSSFLGLDPATGLAREPATAGEVAFEDGRLVLMSPKSGHFQPTQAQQHEVAAKMQAGGVPPFQLVDFEDRPLPSPQVQAPPAGTALPASPQVAGEPARPRPSRVSTAPVGIAPQAWGPAGVASQAAAPLRPPPQHPARPDFQAPPVRPQVQQPVSHGPVGLTMSFGGGNFLSSGLKILRGLFGR